MSITFDLYLNKIWLLCDTMVIKHSYLANAINDDVTLKTNGLIPVDEYRPETWKYYMNLAGEYHQYDKERLLKLSDGAYDKMRIKIAGDFAPIEVDFTRDLISGPNADPATANEYKYGSQYYRELIARYPDFEELILGIIYPVETAISTKAKDGEILRCGEYKRVRSASNPSIFHYEREVETIFNNVQLIEPQENNLLEDIQNYVYSYLGRWINYDYVKTDDLYFQTCWGVMFTGIPMSIINSRLKAYKTNNAHTYHIRELLDSHGYLGRHVDHLNIEVILWLYRNLEYLDASMGMQETFDMILENVFTKSGIPLKTYILAQDSTDAKLGRLPELVGYEMPLNMSNAGQLLDRKYGISDLLNKELGLARDNSLVQADTLDHLVFEGARASSDRYDTKLLESNVIDYSNYIPYRIQDVLLNMWAYSVARGTYRGTAYVTHPKTGDRLQFTMLNAYILFIYCFYKGHAQIDLEKVPNVHVSMIPREPTSPHPDFKPRYTFAQYRATVPVDGMPDSNIRKIIGTETFRSSFNSSLDFYEETSKVWSDLCRLYDYADNCQWINLSCYRHVVARRKFWWGMELSLPLSDMTYNQWFTMQNLDIDGLSSEDYLNLMTELFMYGTGFVENHDRKLKEIQRSCIEIMSHYASYSVHFVSNNSAYAPMMSRDEQLKIESLEFITDMYVPIDSPLIDTTIKTRSAIEFDVPIGETFSKEHVGIHSKTIIPIDVGTETEYVGQDNIKLYLLDNPITVDVVDIYDL